MEIKINGTKHAAILVAREIAAIMESHGFTVTINGVEDTQIDPHRHQQLLTELLVTDPDIDVIIS